MLNFYFREVSTNSYEIRVYYSIFIIRKYKLNIYALRLVVAYLKMDIKQRYERYCRVKKRTNWNTYYMNRFIAVGRTWAAAWKVLRCAFPESTVRIIAYWHSVELTTSIIKVPLRAIFVSSLGKLWLDSIGRCRQQVITSITIMPHVSSFSFANGSDSSERESLTVWHLSRF